MQQAHQFHPPAGSAEEQLARCWRIWAALVVVATMINLLVLMPAGFLLDSTLFHAFRSLTHRAGWDSWAPMRDALVFLNQHPGAPLYQTIFFDQQVKFQYPVTSLLILDVPRHLLKVDVSQVLGALRLLSRLSVPAIGVTFALLMTGAVAKAAPNPSPSVALRNGWLSLGVGVVSAALFYPIARSEEIGQIQTLMTLSGALSLLAWQRGAKGASGLLLGLCCVVKPHWLIAVLWAMLRGQWRFVFAAASVVGACLLLALALYGAGNLVGYVAVVEFIGRHGESFYANQSVNGLVNRLLFNGTNTVWQEHAFPPYHLVVHAATVVSSVLLLGFALLWGRRQQPTTLHLGLVILAMTMASPVAWEHHYSIVLLLFAVLLPPALAYRPLGRATLPLLALAFMLTSQAFFPVANLLAGSRWNVVQSFQFAGAVLTLWLMVRVIQVRKALPDS